jgi:flagellar hook assembly protein FlgD
MTLVVLDASGQKVRTLMESPVMSMVNDFLLSSDFLLADGHEFLKIWADTLFTNGWDGRNEARKLVASGQYYIQVISTDRRGQTTVVTKAVTVQQGKVGLLGPTRLSPNPAHDTVQIWARTGLAGTQVRVVVYSITGELISKLDFGSSDVLTWNITNQKGERLASGIYLVVVTAVDPQTGDSERRVIKLAVLR